MLARCTPFRSPSNSFPNNGLPTEANAYLFNGLRTFFPLDWTLSSLCMEIYKSICIRIYSAQDP
jgi:hypothetical protein